MLKITYIKKKISGRSCISNVLNKRYLGIDYDSFRKCTTMCIIHNETIVRI